MTVVSAALLPAVGAAAPWALKPGVDPLSDGGRTAQKVELVDFDADGWVDIAFANSKGEGVSGGPATREINALLRNAGTDPVSFTEVQGVFEDADNAWVVKAGDVDNDGDADLVVGEVYDGSMSYVLLNEGGGVFTRHDIPLSANRSIGELELGDIDHDGNLDIVAADWGNLPHGQIDDPGAPLRLWLGNGDGSFSDGSAKLAMGADVLAAWSFDLELVDINNDFWLDVMVSTHGDADPAVVLLNDGKGNLVVHPVPALQPMNVKNINTAFTPMDFNGDGFVDVVSLQDGGITACMPDCARRNSILINDQKGQFEIPPNYWTGANNPGKRDFDAATLDFNNDGVPDLVTVGVQLAAFDQNGRLFVNDGSAFTP
ncbi:MAG TPA: VCBS repeat-containing protein, partial [Nannocystis sp.]